MVEQEVLHLTMSQKGILESTCTQENDKPSSGPMLMFAYETLKSRQPIATNPYATYKSNLFIWQGKLKSPSLWKNDMPKLLRYSLTGLKVYSHLSQVLLIHL